MSTNICKIYLNENVLGIFLHYFLFGFIGPLLAVLLIISLHKFLKSKYWRKSLLIYFFINLTSCAIGGWVGGGCEPDDGFSSSPGDLGIVMFTLPVFFLFFFGGIITIYFHKKGKDELTYKPLLLKIRDRIFQR